MESKNLIVVPHVGKFEEEEVVKFLGNLHFQMEQLETLHKFDDASSASLNGHVGDENYRLRLDLREMVQRHTASIRRNFHVLIHELFEKVIDTEKQ